MKKFLSMGKVALILALCFSMFATSNNNASASTKGIQVLSLEEQEALFLTEFETSMEKAEGQEKEELQDDLNKFENFSDEEKETFLGYIFDPEAMDTMLTTLIDIEEGEKKQLLNGDIEVSSEYEMSTNDLDVSAIQNRKATHTRTLSVLGLRILEGQAFVKYTHDTFKILSAYESDAYTNRMLVPFLNLSWTKPSMGYTTVMAHATARVTFSFVHPSFGLVLDTANFQVWGDTKNQTGGSFRIN